MMFSLLSAALLLTAAPASAKTFSRPSSHSSAKLNKTSKLPARAKVFVAKPMSFRQSMRLARDGARGLGASFRKSPVDGKRRFSVMGAGFSLGRLLAPAFCALGKLDRMLGHPPPKSIYIPAKPAAPPSPTN
jgi:hypothetical protein